MRSWASSASGRLQHAGEDFHEGGLARTVGSDQAVAVALAKLDGDVLEQGFGPELHGDVVGGEVVDDVRAEFDPLTNGGLEFTVDGETWLYREKVCLALNKPSGVECLRRPAVHRGVLSLLPDNFTLRDVQPVGRLDHDTTGLLLLSDDGAFIHAQSHPKRHVSKLRGDHA